MVFGCCVEGCKTIATKGLHCFPSNNLLAVKWIMAIKAYNLIGRLNENKLSSYLKVCNRHFNQNDFQENIDGKSQLVANCVPSLFLPGDNIVNNQQ